MRKNILVTGGAGFIGAALCRRLLDQGFSVHAVDNLNDYYDVSLKEDRLDQLLADGNFTFLRLDIADRTSIGNLFASNRFDTVVNLAAQAGVRHSLDNPDVYVDSNLVGFGNILEGCRQNQVNHLVFASSSSVYGANSKLPFSETDSVDHPVSLYAATKKSNELMAHCYAHLYGLPCTGLRFFTVYGPWGRPDMAFFKFTNLMLSGKPIPVYNNGELDRDFTYIDDVITGVMSVIENPTVVEPNKGDSRDSGPLPAVPFKIYNLGNGEQVYLMDYIKTLESVLGVSAIYKMLPMQPGDVKATQADTRSFYDDFGFIPKTSIEEGLKSFADWYRNYYKI